MILFILPFELVTLCTCTGCIVLPRPAKRRQCPRWCSTGQSRRMPCAARPARSSRRRSSLLKKNAAAMPREYINTHVSAGSKKKMKLNYTGAKIKFQLRLEKSSSDWDLIQFACYPSFWGNGGRAVVVELELNYFATPGRSKSGFACVTSEDGAFCDRAWG